MNFFKFVKVTASLFIVIQNAYCGEDDLDEEEDIPIYFQCSEKCQDSESYPEAAKKGELLCAYDKGLEGIFPMVKCTMECQGIKPEEDQSKCWCQYCKKEEDTYMEYCTAPKAGPIKGIEECDSHVCTGKAKFYGTVACKAER